jgi:hypothetical protein
MPAVLPIMPQAASHAPASFCHQRSYSYIQPGICPLKSAVMRKSEIKIISGGQTGVDRAALDAALELGIRAGGWCPEGRLAEDGVIELRYPVRELPQGGYDERTVKNVNDSDATVIITFGEPAGGTLQALQHCIKINKAYSLIDALETSVAQAVAIIRSFIGDNRVTSLNIAGPRASEEAEAYAYTKMVIMRIFQ